MDLMVGATLFTHIFLNYLFIAILTYRIHVISARPEFSTPELFPYFRVKSEDLFCGNTLYDLHNHPWRKNRDALDEKMDVVFIGTNLNEMDLKAFPYSYTYLLQRILYLFGEYPSPVLRGTHDVVKQQRFIVSLEDMLAHPYILPRSRASRNLLIELAFQRWTPRKH